MHSRFLSNPSRKVTLLAALVLLGSLTLSTSGNVVFSKRSAWPRDVSLSIQLRKVGDDGTVEMLGELINVSKRLVLVEVPDSGSLSINAIEEGWDAEQEGWDGWFSLIPVGSFMAPSFTHLKPGQQIDLPHEYAFSPGRYRIMWEYRPRAHDDTSFDKSIVSNELSIEITDDTDD